MNLKKLPVSASRWLVSSGGLLVVVLSSGCASTTQFVHLPDQAVPLEDTNKGRVYVLRTAFAFNIASHSTPVTVSDGPKQIGFTAGHSYLCWEREPGDARIHSTAYHSKTLEFNVEKGNVYYVLQHVGPAWDTLGLPGSGELTATMELLDEEKGKKELSHCKPPKCEKGKR